MHSYLSVNVTASAGYIGYLERKKCNLTILNYIVTSNHIQLLVQDGVQQEVSKSMQLIAGRTAQEVGRRKNPNGAFWEDRHHGTAVDCKNHLIQCLRYIDLNMVRAGVVKHPSEWSQSGFNEIQSPPERYQIIDQEKLGQLLGIDSKSKLIEHPLSWVKDALLQNQLSGDDKLTKSLAVGSQQFVEYYLDSVGIRGNNRQIKAVDDYYVFNEPTLAYSIHL